MVVIGIIAAMMVAIVPAVNSISKSSGQKSAISNVMNALEQARSLAVTSGSATYVVFADQTIGLESHRCKAFVIFQDNATFQQVPVTKWYFLPTGISYLPAIGLLAAPSAGSQLTFNCPQPIGAKSLPYVKFEPSGMVTVPDDPNSLFVNFFAGSVSSGGQTNYTDKNQQTAQKFDSVVLARFTGHARYIDPYAP
jgi:type II secretory pathway pseudopilin PulG